MLSQWILQERQHRERRVQSQSIFPWQPMFQLLIGRHTAPTLAIVLDQPSDSDEFHPEDRTLLPDQVSAEQ